MTAAHQDDPAAQTAVVDAPGPAVASGRTGAAVLVAGSGAAFAAAVAALALAGRWPLFAGWLAVQLAVAPAAVESLGLPSRLGAAAIVAGAAAAADGVAVSTGHARGIAAVVAVAFLVAFGHQLARRDRTLVRAALAGTLGLAVLVVEPATWLALPLRHGGRWAVASSLFAVAAALLVARLASRRPVVGSVAGLALGAGIGAAVGAGAPVLSPADGCVIALVSVVPALAVAVGLETATDGGAGNSPGGSAGEVWRARAPGLVLAAASPLLVSAVPAYVLARVLLA